MKTPLQHLRLDDSIPGCLTVWIDVAERSVNVLFDEVFNELVAVLDEMTCRETAMPLVFRSAKRKGFIVGADLKRILAIETDSEIQSFLLNGQTALQKLEAYPGDTVAVIQGPCLGGGLEFAMACRFRFAADAESTMLGMPEAKLGLMPGWGGTQRLVEIVGYEHGLEMLLGGEPISAHRALELNLVDGLFNERSIDMDLRRFLSDVQLGKIDKRKSGKVDVAMRERFAGQFQNRLSGAQFPQSQSAILQAVTVGIDNGRIAGFDAERTLFYPLLMSPAVQEGLQRVANRPKQ